MRSGQRWGTASARRIEQVRAFDSPGVRPREGFGYSTGHPEGGIFVPPRDTGRLSAEHSAGGSTQGTPDEEGTRDAENYAVGTALVLAASVAGLAVTGGAAQATTDQRVQAASAQTVKLTSTKGGIKVSTTTIRPGNTLFKVYRGGSGGELEVLRLRPG